MTVILSVAGVGVVLACIGVVSASAAPSRVPKSWRR
jgi:hypothetical protein